MKSAASRILVSPIAIAALSSSAWAVDRIKQDNTTALNLAGSWDTLPTSSDIAVWNNTVTGANATALGADLSWEGVKIVNPGGLVTIGTAATNTLTLGVSGIDMSSATQNLLINSNLTAGSAQTWQVAAGRTLQIQTINTNTRLSGSGNINLTNSTGSGTATFDFRPGASGSTAFTDQFGFFNYTGNWTINSGVQLKTLRNGRNAWGSGTITLNGGTVGQQQNFNGTWTNDIILQTSSNSTIDDFNNSGVRTLKLQGVISGSGNLTIAETNANVSYAVNGGVVVTGTNTLNGQVTIAANGVLRVGGLGGNDTSLNAGTSGTLGTSTLVNNGTLTLSRSDTWTFANQITSGSGAVTIGGVTGTLVVGGDTQVVTMSGANSYAGATTVGQGRLNLTGSLTSNITVQAAGRISGTGSTTGSLSTVTGAGIVLAGGDSYTSLVANGVAIGGATTVSFLTNPAAATTYDVFTYGAGGLTGAANLSASWRGSFVDDTINQKYTFVTGASATRTWNTTTGTWDNTGTNNNWAEGDLKFYDGDTAVFGNIASNAAVTLSTNIAPGSVLVQNAANVYTFSGGALTGAATLTKSNAGTLTLTNANTYSGGTTLTAGILRVGNNSAFGTGALALNGGTLSSDSGTLRTLANNLTIGGNVAFGDGTNAGQLVFDGTADLQGSTRVLTSVLGTQGARFNGVISNGGITKEGTGRITLANDSNTFAGGITINEGILATSLNALASSGSVTIGNVGSGGGLAIGSNGTTTINNLSGVTGSVIRTDFNLVSDGARTLSVNQTTNGTFAGTFTQGTNRPISLIKSGSAILGLTGSVNYTGNTTVSQGTLAIGGGGGIYRGAHFSSPVVSVASGAILELQNWNYNQSTASLGGLANTADKIVIDGGTIRMTGTTAYGRGVTVAAGGASFEAAAGTTWTFDDTGDGNVAFVYNDDPSLSFAGDGSFVFNKSFSGTGALTKDGAGTLTLKAANTYTGATTVSAGTLALVGGSQDSAITVNDQAKLGFTLGSPTTSTKAVTLNSGHAIAVTGTVNNSSDYLLMTATSFTGTPTLSGSITNYQLELRAGDTELWLVLSPFAAWAAAYLPADVSNPAGDNDNDGNSNLLEFAFGTDPTDSDAGSLSWDGTNFTPGTPVVNVEYPNGGGVKFTARFIRRTDHDTPGSADYAVQFSSGLNDWQTSTANPTVLKTQGDYQLVQVPYPFFLSNGKKARFFRVGITLVPIP